MAKPTNPNKSLGLAFLGAGLGILIIDGAYWIISSSSINCSSSSAARDAIVVLIVSPILLGIGLFNLFYNHRWVRYLIPFIILGILAVYAFSVFSIGVNQCGLNLDPAGL
jgi:hypothetical protein